MANNRRRVDRRHTRQGLQLIGGRGGEIDRHPQLVDVAVDQGLVRALLRSQARDLLIEPVQPLHIDIAVAQRADLHLVAKVAQHRLGETGNLAQIVERLERPQVFQVVQERRGHLAGQAERADLVGAGIVDIDGLGARRGGRSRQQERRERGSCKPAHPALPSPFGEWVVAHQN